LIEHRLGQPAGERVLLAGVERADDQDTADLHLGTVPELRPGARHVKTDPTEAAEQCLPGERPEGDRGPRTW